MEHDIRLGDTIDYMREMPSNTFNLIIADPPYNLNKDFGEYKEKERKGEWLEWTRDWLAEATRLLSPVGNIMVYGIHKHICWVQCMLFELNMDYRRQIIWHYENGFSGYGQRTLAAHYEPLLWFSKTKNYIYHPIREPYKSQERLKHQITKNGRVWTPHPDGKLAGDVWDFPVLAGKRFAAERVDHPTQKPLSISRRIVRHFSNPGDTILVPFVGSGSECVAAELEGRNTVGFELNADYIAIALKRIEEANSGQLSLLI